MLTCFGQVEGDDLSRFVVSKGAGEAFAFASLPLLLFARTAAPELRNNGRGLTVTAVAGWDAKPLAPPANVQIAEREREKERETGRVGRRVCVKA